MLAESASIVVASQEVDHQARDLIDLLIESEVPGIEQVELGVGHIALISLGSGNDEGGIVTAPHHERWRCVLAKPCLPRMVGRDVGAIVVKEARLDLAL